MFERGITDLTLIEALRGTRCGTRHGTRSSGTTISSGCAKERSARLPPRLPAVRLLPIRRQVESADALQVPHRSARAIRVCRVEGDRRAGPGRQQIPRLLHQTRRRPRGAENSRIRIRRSREGRGSRARQGEPIQHSRRRDRADRRCVPRRRQRHRRGRAAASRRSHRLRCPARGAGQGSGRLLRGEALRQWRIARARERHQPARSRADGQV